MYNHVSQYLQYFSFTIITHTTYKSTYIHIYYTLKGAGCVAQVFRGYLTDKKTKERKEVAIKLIHPHVENMIKIDMELLEMFASFLDKFPSLEILSLGDTCREYCKLMNAQLDLTLEAKNLSQFASKFAEDPWAAFPTPIEGKNLLIIICFLCLYISIYI